MPKKYDPWDDGCPKCGSHHLILLHHYADVDSKDYTIDEICCLNCQWSEYDDYMRYPE